MEMDLVIEHGWIVDGVSPSIYRGTIGISGDKIEYVRPGFSRLPGKRVIDASEYCVAPGFVDVHSHAFAYPGHFTEDARTQQHVSRHRPPPPQHRQPQRPHPPRHAEYSKYPIANDFSFN